MKQRIWSAIVLERNGKLIQPPDVRYMMYLECLGKLCSYMQEKYNTDYVWGDRKLKDDVAKSERLNLIIDRQEDLVSIY